MESIFRDTLLHYFEKQDLLTSCQHGFRKRKSCPTNLLETLESWTRLPDEGYGIDAIYLDYKKAFDMVSYRELPIGPKELMFDNRCLPPKNQSMPVPMSILRQWGKHGRQRCVNWVIVVTCIRACPHVCGRQSAARNVIVGGLLPG